MGSTHLGFLEMDKLTANPTYTPSTDRRVIAAVNSELHFWNGTTWVNLEVGGGSINSWETIFANDSTFTITPDTPWTIAGNRTTATDVIEITNVGSASGDLIKFQNSGTGKDISGTDDTWSFTKAGALVAVGITPGGDITTTALAVDWDLADNNAAALSFDSAGAAGILVIVTTDNSEGVTMANTLAVSGAVTMGVGSNTVESLIITDNTITSNGADANSSGMVVFRSTSLTSGSLLQLQTTESNLSGGFYLTLRDVTAGANVLTLGEDGAMVIAGVDGSTMLTLTLGDLLISDGSITVTDSDNANTIDATNNTITTADMVDINSTTISTGALVKLNANTTAHDGEVLEIISAGDTTATPTGISITIADVTTGAAKGIDIVMAGATTGPIGLDITMAAMDTSTASRITVNGLTTGTGQLITSSGTMLTTGNLLTLTANSATTAAGLFRINGNGLTTGIAGVITSSATAITGAGRLLRVDHTGTTSTSGILTEFASAATDETNIVTITASDTLIAGSCLDIVATSMTTGVAIRVDNADALTTGILVDLESAATAITGAGRMLRVDHSGATGGSAVLSEFTSAANDETVILRVGSTAALAGGVLLDLVGASVTTGTILQASGLDALTTGGVLNIVSNSSDTGTRTLVQITNDNTAATGAECLSLKNDSTAGAAMSITGTGVLGIDMSALGVADSILKATGTTDTTMKAPQTVAADEFLKIDIGGTAHYIPCYTVA